MEYKHIVFGFVRSCTFRPLAFKIDSTVGYVLTFCFVLNYRVLSTARQLAE